MHHSHASTPRLRLCSPSFSPLLLSFLVAALLLLSLPAVSHSQPDAAGDAAEETQHPRRGARTIRKSQLGRGEGVEKGAARDLPPPLALLKDRTQLRVDADAQLAGQLPPFDPRGRPLSVSAVGAGPKGSNGWLRDIPATVQQRYLVNVGTSANLSDVMQDDEVSRSYSHSIGSAGQLEGGQLVPEVVDFFIWRRRAEGETVDAARSITVQRPIVFVKHNKLVSASVSNWGPRSMRLLPAVDAPANTGTFPAVVSNHLEFTLTTNCLATGSTTLTVTIRLFEMTQGQRSKSVKEFALRRVCNGTQPQAEGEQQAQPAAETEAEAAAAAGADGAAVALAPAPPKLAAAAAADQSTPVPGFDVYVLQAPSREELAISHGKPTARFTANDKAVAKKEAGAGEEEPDVYRVPSNVMRTDFEIRYKGKKKTLAPPTLVVEDPDILTVSDSFRGSTKLLLGAPKRYSLSYSCRKAGTTALTVVFTFVEDRTERVTFGFEKRCSGEAHQQGVPGMQIDIGTTAAAHDVVDDGVTQPAYLAITRWDEAQWATRAAPVPSTVTATQFFISTAATEAYSYEPPVVTSFTESGSVLAHPHLSGDFLDQRQLQANAPAELVLEYRCLDAGVAAFTISFQVKNAGSVQWTVRKECAAPDKAEIEERETEDEEEKQISDDLGTATTESNQTNSIPGLNIGFSRTASGQMADGVVRSLYRLQESVNDLAFCPANRQFLTFYLYQNASVPGAVDVAYGKPELIADRDISAPIVSGHTKGGVVNATHHASFTITFHCLSDGQTTYTLTLPLLPLEGRRPPRSSIVLSFLKSCNASAPVQTAEIGGVGIQGFRIGRQRNGSDVVSDGFPSIHYFGQKHKPDPDWSGIIVPESELSTTFYFSYILTRKNIGEPVIHFHPPVLISHSSLLKPELSGSAAKGGSVVKNSASSPHLDLTYNCRYAGLVTVTIIVPVASGQITFTVPKQCGGKAVPQGSLHKGLMIGLTPGGSEVAKDGLVSTVFADGSFRVDEDEDVTTFYVRQEDGVFQAIEPLVRSYSRIALAVLSHDMYVSKGPGGELLRDDDKDEYVFDEADAEDDPAADKEQEGVQAIREEAAKEGDSDIVQDELDDVYVDRAGARINVSYSCMEGGSTKVRVTWPLKVGYLEWTWTKLCPAGEDWFMAGIRPGGSTLLPDEDNADGDDDDDADENTDDHDEYGDAPPVPAAARLDDDDDEGGGLGNAAHSSRSSLYEESYVMEPAGYGDDDDEEEVSPRGQPEGEWREAAQLHQELAEGAFQNDPYEQHVDAESREFTRTSDVVVSSSLSKALKGKGDVFYADRINPRYSRPEKTKKDTPLDVSHYAIVSEDEERTSFFISLNKEAKGGFSIGKPTVAVPGDVRRANIDPRVVGETVEQVFTQLDKDRQPVELTVEWRCAKGGKGGLTPAYVTIPLTPSPEAGHVSFYLIKMCRGADEESGSSRSYGLYAMLLLGVIGSVCGLLWYNKADWAGAGLAGGGSAAAGGAAGSGNSRNGRRADTLERGAYEIVPQKEPKPKTELTD